MIWWLLIYVKGIRKEVASVIGVSIARKSEIVGITTINSEPSTGKAGLFQVGHFQYDAIDPLKGKGSKVEEHEVHSRTGNVSKDATMPMPKGWKIDTIGLIFQVDTRGQGC
jgi:hypothetical protein